jgi:hypothetical protein
VRQTFFYAGYIVTANEELSQGIKVPVVSVALPSRQKASKVLAACAQLHDIADATGK